MQAICPPKNTQNNAKNRKYTGGNAIIIILVIIALLSALTAVAMRSSNRTASNMDTESARIQAEKLMRSAKTIETTVRRLMSVNRCSENELSFENSSTTRDYTNSNTPTDNRCKLFDLNGGGLTYTAPDTAALDSSLSAYSDYGQWVVLSSQCVLGIGSDDDNTCTDDELALVYAVPFISLPVCLQINKLNGVNNPSNLPPEEDSDNFATPFAGDFSAYTDPEVGEGLTGVELRGHTTSCFRTTSIPSPNIYIFYHIIYAR